MAIWRGDGGAVRSGWQVAIFALLAGLTQSILGAVLTVLRLLPRAPMTLDDPRLAFTSLAMLITAGLATLACRWFFRSEVGLRSATPMQDFCLGAGLGALLLALVMLGSVASGAVRLRLSDASWTAVLAAGVLQLLTLAPTAIGEELLLRGVVLRELARGTHPALAAGSTGIVFGLLHLGNPNASWVAALNIALVGCWFGALVLRTSLWAGFGLHLTWNWCEGFLWGQPVSGIRPGLSPFVSTWGPAGFFSGSDFGPEAAGLTAVLLLLATGATIVWPRRAVTAS
jgi:uncharacterized protein